MGCVGKTGHDTYATNVEHALPANQSKGIGRNPVLGAITALLPSACACANADGTAPLASYRPMSRLTGNAAAVHLPSPFVLDMDVSVMFYRAIGAILCPQSLC